MLSYMYVNTKSELVHSEKGGSNHPCRLMHLPSLSWLASEQIEASQCRLEVKSGP